MSPLLQAVSDLDNLHACWRSVRAQVRQTRWPHVLADLEGFERRPLAELSAIREALLEGGYRFSPKVGYAKRKSGGSRRGITVQRVGDRIVQKAILRIVSSKSTAIRGHLGDLPEWLSRPTSFAGTPGRGVPEAIAMAWEAMKAGNEYVALSDMIDFFPCVPRKLVMDLLGEQIRDHAFLQLFERAIETVLDNPEQVEEWIDLFPLGEVGVAQGSLLSVLAGNLALIRFDEVLNAGPLTTVRYLDDFAILADTAEQVGEGFAIANAELAKLGMACYQPGDGSQKAYLGPTRKGFIFLGCRLHPDGVGPSRASQRKLIREVVDLLKQAKFQIRQLAENDRPRRTEPAYAQTLSRIDQKVRGWGDAYRFVSNRLPFAQMDRQIDRLLDDFHHWFARLRRAQTHMGRARSLGVALLQETPGPSQAKPGPSHGRQPGSSE